MDNLKNLLIILLIFSLNAQAELNLSQPSQQLRVLGAYGLSYTTKDMYRSMGASKTLSWVLSGLTTMGAGYAIDRANGESFGTNAMAYGLGALGGSFTHSLFDGDEAPKGYRERQDRRIEQKNEQRVNVNISFSEKKSYPEYIVTSDNKVVAKSKSKRESRRSVYINPLFSGEK